MECSKNVKDLPDIHYGMANFLEIAAKYDRYASFI